MCSHVLHGWRFWSVEGTEKPKREPKADKPAKAAAKKAPAKKAGKSKGKKVAKKKVARAAAKGDSYGCGVCPETFPTQKKAVAHALTHTA